MRLFSRIFCALSVVCAIAVGQPARNSVGRPVVPATIRSNIAERQAVTAAAARFVGTRETGQNRGAVYDLFIRPYGYGPGTMYCGLFAHHVFVVAGVAHHVKGPALAANWAVPGSSIVWQNGRSVGGRVPLAGDLALFRFGGGRINHVELIINWPSNERYCWVIGGNTSNPNGPGEGVFAKKRLKTEMIVVSRLAMM